MTTLIAPYGGRLVNLLAPEEERAALREYASALPTVLLSERAASDLESLAVGAFSPLAGFMGEADYRSVLGSMRLADGTLYPIPVTLPVAPSDDVAPGREVVLRDAQHRPLAVMAIEEAFAWDPDEEVEALYGPHAGDHPLAAEVRRRPRLAIAGALRVIEVRPRYDFCDLRLSPADVRRRLEALGYERVAAYQPEDPPDRAHEALAGRAAEEAGAALLVQPVVGPGSPGGESHYTLARTHRAVYERYADRGRTLLALLPLATRSAGAREALWRAIIARNYGADHLIVAPEVAEGGDALSLLAALHRETGVRPLCPPPFVYVPGEGRLVPADRVPPEAEAATLSPAEARAHLAEGRPLPEWYARPEVARILEQAYPPRHRQGYCVWFTGLSGSGKSTIAGILTVRLEERGRTVTALDGDVVRTHLSRGLGFTKADRDTNIRRIGFVAAEIVRHGGVAVCAAVSPYRATRDEVRAMVGPERFVEVFVDTPLDVCEARDVKGLYAQARRGEITGFTGIDDPYEPPLAPELTLGTVDVTPEENAQRVVDWLVARGYLPAE